MPDQRSVMKEFRYLDEKRVVEGLTPEEEARYARLRDLVGPEMGAGGIKPGFDVTAAAAKLRDSLMPAGLRNRPPPTPEPSPEPEPEPEPVAEGEPSGADALASAYSEQPFEPLEGQGATADAYFDPAQLGIEAAAQPYDPNAQAYDPGAQPYDPNAQAGWDPNQPWDPNAPYDPNAQAGWDPNQAWDPNAAAPGAEPYDPNAQPYDPGAQGYDPNAPYDPNAQAGWDPNQPWDPNAAAVDAGAGYYPNAPAYDPAQPPDPLADAQEAAAFDAGQEWQTVAQVEEGFAAAGGADAGLDAAAEPMPDAAAPDETGGAIPPEGWTPEAPLPEPAAADAPLGEYDGEAGGGFDLPDALELASATSFDAEAAPVPYATPLGEYDDTSGFARDSYAAADVPSNAPGLDLADIAPGGAENGGWQPDAKLEEGFQLASGGSFGTDAEWASGAAPTPPWQDIAPLDVPAEPEAAIPPMASDAAGFEIAPTPEAEAFGEAAAAPFEAAPDLAVAGEPFPAEADPLAVAVDAVSAEAVFEATADAAVAPAPVSAAEPSLDFEVGAQAQAAQGEPVVAEATPSAPAPVEEIATLEGADILEEIHEDAPAPPPRSLDFEPLVAAPQPPLAAPPPAPAAAIAAAPPPPPPPAASAPAAKAAPAPIAPAPTVPAVGSSLRVAGSHRVVVHTVEGQVKRGALQDADLDGASLALTQPGSGPEVVPTEKVKAIFFMLAPGEPAPAPEGKKVRVTFRDGRQVAGFSPNYDETGVGFFMIPGDTRTNTGRIWVYRAAVRQVAVS